MIDKGKYSSHGAMIKKLPNFGLAKWQKTKLAVINPLPSTQPRQKNNQFKQKRDDIKLQSKAINTIFKFQQKIKHKPLQEDLIQPFLYIQKVIKKTKVDDKQWKNLKPFVASSKVRLSSAKNQKISQNLSQIPSSYANLFDYQQDKRKTADKFFKKLLEADVTNLKDVYLMWNKKVNIKENSQIDVKQKEFIDFMKQLVRQKLTQKQLKHFFDLYKKKNVQVNKKEALKNSNKDQKLIKGTISLGIDLISIKSLSFNYEKYLRNEVQINNIMSQKSLKQRYTWVKRYLTLFNQNYQQLKQAMNSIKQYQQALRQHFKAMYSSYKNPYQQQIFQLKKELQKPIIKYDKHKKDLITQKIEELQNKNKEKYENITQEYQQFIQNYETTIVKNHDLFFNKRIICKLVLPILNTHSYLNQALLQKEIDKQQELKQKYLQCLSNLVVQIERDKKILGEDCFTLADMVDLVLMKFNKKKKKGISAKQVNNEILQLGQQFVLKAVKKLIKQIKKQYLLKNELYVQNMDQFPADQQIPIQILLTCFEMQCTKVLSKNHIWTELLNLIPQTDKKSKFHQNTISSNQCLGYLKKYFIKLDQNSQTQRNKSRQISLLIQNANLDSLWYFNKIIEKVNNKMNNYNEDADEEEDFDHVNQLQIKKKVNFADLAQSVMQNENKKYFKNQEEQTRNKQYNHEQNIVAKDILKAIFNQEITKIKSKPQNLNSSEYLQFFNIQHTAKNQGIPQSLQALKTLSKSFFVPQKDKKLTTNAFDIRFYEKMKNKEMQQEQIIRLGNSMLLSHLPKPSELQPSSIDPLKISKYLEHNITNFALEQQKRLKQKNYSSNVKQGVDINYFKDNIKLQNRPTRYDSQGKSKYSVLFPVGYYEGMFVNQTQKDQKWYLRSHHVETLTENPLSKKDNLINTEYQSKLERIPLKKRAQQFVIEQNVNRKDNLIQSLEERINHLKDNLENVQRNKVFDGQKVPNALLNKYLTGITEGKQDKDLELGAYQAVLYDLRRDERNLVNDFRSKRNDVDGQPQQKWWQKKDSSFNIQLRKERLLVADSLREGSPHKKYVQKLKNKEIY